MIDIVYENHLLQNLHYILGIFSVLYHIAFVDNQNKIHENIFYNLGVSEAENGLGNSYRDGRGVDIDFKKAFNHYLRSAEFGCPEGQNNVGVFLINGNGVKTNHEYAREWFRKAAEQNIAEAQLNYAEMLENGEGGPIKETEAIEYYKKAAEQGSPSALTKLQSLAFANK